MPDTTDFTPALLHTAPVLTTASAGIKGNVKKRLSNIKNVTFVLCIWGI
jgi:hypothetical protein